VCITKSRNSGPKAAASQSSSLLFGFRSPGSGDSAPNFKSSLVTTTLPSVRENCGSCRATIGARFPQKRLLEARKFISDSHLRHSVVTITCYTFSFMLLWSQDLPPILPRSFHRDRHDPIAGKSGTWCKCLACVPLEFPFPFDAIHHNSGINTRRLCWTHIVQRRSSCNSKRSSICADERRQGSRIIQPESRDYQESCGCLRNREFKAG
jgi:hypothetical protein